MPIKVLLFNIEKIKKRNLFVYDNIKFSIKRFYFHNKLKKGYQCKTKANLNNLRSLGYIKKFINLRDGIQIFFEDNDK